MREYSKIIMQLTKKNLPKGERERLKELALLILKQLTDSRAKTVILDFHPSKR
jgi:hypothetical protein